MLTKQDYEVLQPHEKILYTAFYGKYIRVLKNDEFDTIYAVFSKYRKDIVCRSCTNAKLKMCQVIGQWYFDYKDKHSEDRPIEDVSKPVPSKPAPKKQQRKKKMKS